MEEILNKILEADDLIIRIVAVIFILIITVYVKRLFSKLITRYIEKSSKLIKVDPTQYALMRHLITALIYFTGIGLSIYIIPPLRTFAVSLFAGAGIMAVIIGFASQKAVSNLISGIFIAIFKPFRVGDVIRFSDKIGVVEDINLRQTVIKNFENKRDIVPKSVISEETIENFNINDEKTCRYVDFRISYDSDIDKAMEIMKQEALNHPLILDIRTPAEIEDDAAIVSARVIGFGDSSVNLRAWVWAKDPGAAFRMGCDLNKSIKEAFDREGIEIPFPYRTIVYKDQKDKE